MHPESDWKPDLIDVLQQPIWTVRPDGSIADANAFWRDYTGLREETALGQSWGTAVHPDDAPIVEERWTTATQRDEPFEIEYRFQRADGVYRWHIARVAPIPGPDAASRWWGAIAIDIEERRQAREALRASEANFRDIVAHANDIIYTFRPDGTITAVNPAVERVLGYKPEALIGKNLDSLIAPDQLSLSHSMLARKLEGKSSSTYDLDAMAWDGRRVTLEVNTRLVENEGQPAMIHGVARDISSRRHRIRQAELSAAIGTALASQLALTDQLQACAQALVDHLGAAFARVWLVDARDPSILDLQASAGLYTHLDGAHSRISVGEMKIGRIAAERRPFLSNTVATDPEISDHDWARREGIVAFAGYPILLGGRLLGVIGLFSRYLLDETTQAVLSSIADTIAVAIERDRAERARDTVLARERDARVWAELAETRYRNLFEGVADAILVADSERRYQDANPAALALLGYERDELLNLRVEDIVASEQAWTKEEYASYLDTNRWVGELELRHKDGTIMPVEARATVVQLPTGKVYLSAVRDITERKHLERLQRDFLAMVTHDIRTPLTSIKGWLQMLQRRAYLEERDRGTVGRTLDQVEKISHLINDLADLVRIEAGQLQLRPKPLDLVALVREQVSMVQEQTDRHTLRIESPEAPIEGTWDRQRLGQVLQNLLTNAVKYSPDGSEITIRIEPDGDRVRVQVIDPGIGIAPDHLPLLFERFYRAGVTGAGGLGLGLHITRMLVEAHGGTISAESERGAGSTFTVSLPLTPPTNQP